MKKHTKSIVTSLLMALAFGAMTVSTTYALFTSQAKTEIEIAAGKVKVEQELEIVSVSELGDVEVDPVNGVYTNSIGGKTYIDSTTGELKLEKWAPGDKAVLRITVNNESDVAIKTRFRENHTSETNPDLYDALSINYVAKDALNNDITYKFLEWNLVEPTDTVISTITATIEFPDSHNGAITFDNANDDNQYQNTSCALYFTQEAVQGNANVASLIDQMNAALASKAAVDGANHTLNDALKDVEAVASVAAINAAGYLYDASSDQFIYPQEAVAGSLYKYFKIYDAMPAEQTYSIYAYGWTGVTSVNLNGVGFDAGNVKGITSVNYSSNAAPAKTLAIRTNSAYTNVSINAYVNPQDSTDGDVINHYGTAGTVNITKVPMGCYYENGTTAYVKLLEGKVVAKTGGEIAVLFTTNNVIENVAAVEDGGTINVGYTTAQAIDESNRETYNGIPLTYSIDGINPVTESDVDEIGEAAVTEARADEDVKEDYPEETFWEDCIGDAELDGIGTENNPYRVYTPMQLALVSHNVNNEVGPDEGKVAYDEAYYKLMANINLGGKAWTPIGNKKTLSVCFGGKIDGNGFKITGLSNGEYHGEITQNHTTGHIGETYGFIGYTRGEVVIKNLTLTQVNIEYDNAKVCGALIGNTGSDNVGSDAAFVTTTKLHIINVHVDGNVKAYDKAAGLVGYLINVPDIKVEDCSVAGTISLTNYGSKKGYRAGGLFGYISIADNNTYEEIAEVIDTTVTADILKGDSTADYFWLGGISSCFNSLDAAFTIKNFTFTGEDENELTRVTSTYVASTTIGSFLGVKDANGRVLIGSLGRVIARCDNSAYDPEDKVIMSALETATQACYLVMDFDNYQILGRNNIIMQAYSNKSQLTCIWDTSIKLDTASENYTSDFLALVKAEMFVELTGSVQI